MRVLVVDDAPDIVLFLTHALEMQGHEVHGVTSEFGRLLNRERWAGVDAVVLDLMLGDDITGYDIACFIRQNRLPVRAVVLSAVSHLDLSLDLEEVADVVLTKPASPDDIVRAVAGGRNDG